MPTDGTLIFENMPSGRQCLVTALAVFYSITSGEDSTPTRLEDNLWDEVIFTLGGCPGALVRPSILVWRHFTDG
jgi:hypothetical protein